jgi:outer membrane protein TolC
MKSAKFTWTFIVGVIVLLSSRTGFAKEAAVDKAAPVISLAEAHRMALARYPKVKNIEESVTLAKTRIQQAFAMVLPTLTASARLVRNSDEVSLSMPDFSSFNPTDSAAQLPLTEMVIQEKWSRSLGVTASLPLYTPGAISQIKMARAGADEARWTSRMQKEDILFSVTTAYYQLNAIDQMIAVARENLHLASEFLRHSRALEAAGQKTGIDVLRADITLSDAQKRLDDADDDYRIARLTLGTLIGQEGDFQVAPPRRKDDTHASPSQLKEKALQQRAEIRAAETRVEMSRLNQRSTSARWLPRVDVSWNWNWNSAEGFAGENDSWQLIFGASWNIFDGGATIAEYRQRQSESVMAKNSMQDAVLNVKLEVDTAVVEVKKHQRNVALAERQVELASRQHALVEKQYKAGMSTSLELMDATTGLTQAKATLVTEQLQFDLALLKLRKAVGRYHQQNTLN